MIKTGHCSRIMDGAVYAFVREAEKKEKRLCYGVRKTFTGTARQRFSGVCVGTGSTQGWNITFDSFENDSPQITRPNGAWKRVEPTDFRLILVWEFISFASVPSRLIGCQLMTAFNASTIPGIMKKPVPLSPNFRAVLISHDASEQRVKLYSIDRVISRWFLINEPFYKFCETWHFSWDKLGYKNYYHAYKLYKVTSVKVLIILIL